MVAEEEVEAITVAAVAVRVVFFLVASQYPQESTLSLLVAEEQGVPVQFKVQHLLSLGYQR